MSFRENLKRYGHLINQRENLSPTENLEIIYLIDGLCVRHVHHFLAGVYVSLEHLRSPGYPVEHTGYARLLCVIFPNVFTIEENLHERTFPGQMLLKQYLSSVCELEETQLPNSLADLERQACHWYIESLRTKIMPIWTDEAFELIDNEIRLLDERSAYVIRVRYQIGTTHKTLEALGEELQLTRSRVQQIETRAIEKLRTRSHWFEMLVHPIGNSLQEQLQKHDAIRTKDLPSADTATDPDGLIRESEPITVPLKATNFPSSTIPMHVLLIPISELNLKTRLRAVLEHYQYASFRELPRKHIQLLGDLIQISEREMCKQRNCGAMSMNTLKQELAKYHLTFDTILDPKTKSAFDSKRANLFGNQ